MANTTLNTDPRLATVERTLAHGTTVRLLLVPHSSGRVRIVEYHRRRRGESRFVRVRDEEGAIVAFEHLRLDRTYQQVFPQGSLFGPDGCVAGAS